MTLYSQFKRWLVGEPLPTSAFDEERLSNAAALAILSSDALSSVAYATEEILLVLVLAGGGVLGLSLPIAGAIIILLAIISLSYRQTIRAYPHGGGAYRVARENLGLYPGLVAAGALMIDYILTVTVSVSAGIAALTSAVPILQSLTTELCLVLIVLLMIANLRGVRSSGRIFSIPTYGFIVTVFLMIGMGTFQHLTGGVVAAPPTLPSKESLSLFLICRAFAAGCTALTGVEAISDGVMVFKSPEWQNARRTLLNMVIVLGIMFLGITYLAHTYQVIPEPGQTVMSLLGRHIFGMGFLYYFLQGTTLLILMLAANTSFADFPRLSYFLAHDRFLPRQLLLLGDRLVYSNGIILLSVCAAVLIIIFRGNTNAIIPLYAVGVFTSFTLSQSGMVMHWLKEKTPGWRSSAIINGIGAIVTAIVLIIITATKFLLGAWIVVIAIPLVVKLFLAINHHYAQISQRLSIEGLDIHPYPRKPTPAKAAHPSVVLIGQIHRGTLEALDYARSVSDEIVGVHVDVGETDETVLRQRWQRVAADIPLEILHSPYRSVVGPLSDFVGKFEAERPGVFCTIVIPVFVTRHWWEDLLHNQTAIFLRQALRAKRSRVVAHVRYYL